MARRVSIGADQDLGRRACMHSAEAFELRAAIADQPRLVATPEAGRTPAGEDAEREIGRLQHQSRLTWRSSRRFFATWRSLSTFFLPSYGLAPSLNTKRIGVPTSLKRLRKKFSR